MNVPTGNDRPVEQKTSIGQNPDDWATGRRRANDRPSVSLWLLPRGELVPRFALPANPTSHGARTRQNYAHLQAIDGNVLIRAVATREQILDLRYAILGMFYLTQSEIPLTQPTD